MSRSAGAHLSYIRYWGYYELVHVTCESSDLDLSTCSYRALGDGQDYGNHGNIRLPFVYCIKCKRDNSSHFFLLISLMHYQWLIQAGVQISRAL